MRQILTGVLVVGLLAITGCGGYAKRPEWTDSTQAVSDGSNQFAFDLYRKLAEKPGNVFFSPFSAHAALAMTADGAVGPTRDEMVKVLHLPADRDRALAAGDLGRYYAAGGDGYELAVANAIWGQKGFPWRADFLDRQKQRVGAGLNEADFKMQPDAERLRVNGWAADRTRGRIKDLLPPKSVDPLTRMVLANAIYFKGEWGDQFDKSSTADAPFTLADGSKKSVRMMARKKGSARARFGDDVAVAELSYKGSELAMVVLLPAKPDGLPAVEKALSPWQLDAWLAEAHATKELPIYLPKFQFEINYTLNRSLEELGMSTAFDPDRADFHGMHSGPDQLFVSLVVQKAFVDVNEEGTEAAAATAVVMFKTTTAKKPMMFRADHPFLFLIRDTKHGTILFMGRYEGP